MLSQTLKYRADISVHNSEQDGDAWHFGTLAVEELWRILTLGLAGYSYRQIKAKLPENLHGRPATIVSRVLFGTQLQTSAVFFLIPYFPEVVHFGSRRLTDYTAKQLERITPRPRDMMDLRGLLMALFFCVNIFLLTVQARSVTLRESAHALSSRPRLIGGLLAGQAITTFYYLARFYAASHSETDAASAVG